MTHRMDDLIKVKSESSRLKQRLDNCSGYSFLALMHEFHLLVEKYFEGSLKETFPDDYEASKNNPDYFLKVVDRAINDASQDASSGPA